METAQLTGKAYDIHGVTAMKTMLLAIAISVMTLAAMLATSTPSNADYYGGWRETQEGQ